jgi:hypothetical protein
LLASSANAVALAEAERSKDRDQLSRGDAEIAIGPARFVVGDGGAIGETFDRRDQHGANRTALVQRSHDFPPFRLDRD